MEREREREREEEGEESDVKSEIIINDSHEDECLIYMRRSMASRKGMRVPCALGQFAPCSPPHPPFELFIFAGRNLSLVAVLIVDALR